MQRWHGLHDVPQTWGRSVVTVGVFDGVHRGHQRIVARATELGSQLALPVVVVTFDPHPDEVVRPGSHPPLLCTPRYRGELLGKLGADAVCVLPFTYEFSQVTAEDFVRAVLVDGLHAAAVVIGENFRFGHKAAGNVALLAELGEKYEFAAEGVPLLTDSGVTVSSSWIRELLSAGDVAGAARDLGRPHRVEGVVVRGHQRGRALGFPTANAEPPPFTAIPADGVYAGWLVRLDVDGTEVEHGGGAGRGGRVEYGGGAGGGGRVEHGGDAGRGGQIGRWPAAISVGSNPTFDGVERTVEAYALDRDDLDLYGVRVAIEFAERIRGQVRFSAVDDLIEQMGRDVAMVRPLVAGDS